MAAPRHWWWMRDRRSERFWTSFLRRHTVTAASTGACVRPTLSCRLVRWARTHAAHAGNKAHAKEKIINRRHCCTCFLIISERGFEDHENLVEPLSAWTRFSENKIHFVSRPQKYVMFTEPQVSTSKCFLLAKVLLHSLMHSQYTEQCYSHPEGILHVEKEERMFEWD